MRSDNCSYNMSKECLIWFLVLLSFNEIAGHGSAWSRPSCELIEIEETVSIKNCVMFSIKLGSCHGFCKSQARPSSLEALMLNPNQPITSMAKCCGISETEKIPVSVLCLSGEEQYNLTSATSCACQECIKD